MKTLLLSISCLSFTVLNAQQNFKYLDINNVKAGVTNLGDMHSNPNTGAYANEVPKGSGKHSNSVSCLWIGGKDNLGKLHLSAQRYRDDGMDYFAGPLDTVTGTTSATVSNQYDKIWKLNRTDIDAFITNFSNGKVQNHTYAPVADLLSWPAHGVGRYTRNMAPFVDMNHNGVYDPLIGGDYPEIKGDQALYFIFNDNLINTTDSNKLPMLVEVHAMAYAYGNSAYTSQHVYLRNATFYNYKIINRSNQNYHDMFVSMWSDGHIGADYVNLGCDVENNFGYAYNDSDPYGVYGNNNPASGYQILRGSVANGDGIDNNNNGVIDEECEQQLMTGFTYYRRGMICPIPVDPDQDQEYYNYMTGYWNDGTPFTCGGSAYGGTNATPFVFTGTSYPNSPCGSINWQDYTMIGEKSMILNSGPFTFAPNEIKEFEFAHCTSFKNANISAVDMLKYDMQSIKDFKDFQDPVACNKVSVEELINDLGILLYPNPASSSIIISSGQKITTDVSIEIIDVVGKTLFATTSKELSQLTIDVSNFSSGIYFLKISADGRSTTKKFVKE